MQTLQIINIRPYGTEQRIPDVTVRSNEYLPGPDNRVSHNEWYAVSWEMNFGTQIDGHTMSEITNKYGQTTTLEMAHTNHADTTQEGTETQSERGEKRSTVVARLFKSYYRLGG